MKFNWRRFRSFIEKKAAELSVSFDQLVIAMNAMQAKEAPHGADCLNCGDISKNTSKLSAEKREHLKTCVYSQMFLKTSFIPELDQSNDPKEIRLMAKLLEEVAEEKGLTADELTEKIALAVSAGRGADCYELGEVILYFRLPFERRMHRRKCLFCDIFITTFEKMELPEL